LDLWLPDLRAVGCGGWEHFWGWKHCAGVEIWGTSLLGEIMGVCFGLNWIKKKNLIAIAIPSSIDFRILFLGSLLEISAAQALGYLVCNINDS